MADLFHLEIKSEQLTVQTFLRLQEIKLSNDHFGAKYQHSIVLPNESELKVRDQPVDRSIEVVKGGLIDFNGVQISLTDFITIGAQFAEMYRAEDDATKPIYDGGVIPAIH